jgi:hypothetical protein
MSDAPESAFADHRQARCPVCLAHIQRTPKGTVDDGMAAHTLAVHKGEETVSGG